MSFLSSLGAVLVASVEGVFTEVLIDFLMR